MGQQGIGVGKTLFKPGPILGRGAFEKIDQPFGQRIAGLRGNAVAAQAAKIFVDAQERIGPGAGRFRVEDGGQRPLEHLGGPRLQMPMLGASRAGAERPERAALAVLRALGFEPAPVIAHEIAEPLRVGIEGVLHEARVGFRQPVQLGPLQFQFLQQHRGDQRAGIVVGAIAVMKIGQRVDRVLIDAGGIGHPRQVIEAQGREAPAALPPAS